MHLTWCVWVVDRGKILSVLHLVYPVDDVIWIYWLFIIRGLVVCKIWLWSPKSQVVCVESIETGDRDIVCDSLNSVFILPGNSLRNWVWHCLTTKLDLIHDLRSLKLPRISFLKPLSRHLSDLSDFIYFLKEEPILIPETIPPRWDVQSG